MKYFSIILLDLSRPEHDQLIVIPFVITRNISTSQNRSSDFIGSLDFFPALPQLAPILEDAAELEHGSRHLIAKIFALFKRGDRLIKQQSVEKGSQYPMTGNSACETKLRQQVSLLG